MKATSHGQGFYHSQIIHSEYHKIMTSALLAAMMTGQKLNLSFLRKLSKTFFCTTATTRTTKAITISRFLVGQTK